MQSTHSSVSFMFTPTSPTHPLASFQNGLGCTLLQHNTLHALLPSPTPRQECSPVGRELAPHRLRLAGCTLGARQRRGFSPQLLRATWSRPNVFISTMPTCDSRRWALLPGCDTKHNEWIARVLFELGSLIQVINSTGETSQKCELKTWQGLILNENK